MAKTTGPLFSLTASGTVGKTITYSNWKGRPYVRRRVIPLNPMSADQQAVRNAMRCLASSITWANVTAMKTTPPGITDKANVSAVTPDGFAWNGYILQNGVGTNMDNYDAAIAAWNVLTTEKATWTAAAAALTPAMLPAPQVGVGGIPATPLVAGCVFFVYRYALYCASLAPLPGAVPPTYA